MNEDFATGGNTSTGFFQTVRRRKLLIAVCVLLGAAAALGLSLRQQKQYSSSASLLFRDPGFDQELFGTPLISGPVDPTREAATNLKLVSLRIVATRTAKAIGGGLTPGAVTGA